jgi:hypothetical protein
VTRFPATNVRATLRVATSDADRDAAIVAWRQESPAEALTLRRVVIAEGVLLDRIGPDGVPLVGLAAGCPCCTGSVALRVVLGRTLRRIRPDSILLLVATADHLPRLRRLLEDGELGVRFEVET